MNVQVNYGAGASSSHTVYKVFKDGAEVATRLPANIDVNDDSSLAFAYINTGSTIQLSVSTGAVIKNLGGDSDYFTLNITQGKAGPPETPSISETVSFDINNGDPLATYEPISADIYDRGNDRLIPNTIELLCPSAPEGSFNYNGSQITVYAGQGTSTFQLTSFSVPPSGGSNKIELNDTLTSLLTKLKYNTDEVSIVSDEERHIDTFKIAIHIVRSGGSPAQHTVSYSSNYADSKITIGGKAANGTSGQVTIPSA